MACNGVLTPPPAKVTPRKSLTPPPNPKIFNPPSSPQAGGGVPALLCQSVDRYDANPGG